MVLVKKHRKRFKKAYYDAEKSGLQELKMLYVKNYDFVMDLLK